MSANQRTLFYIGDTERLRCAGFAYIQSPLKELDSAEGSYGKNIARAFGENGFHFLAESIEHIKRNEGLDRSGKAAAVNSPCALALKQIFAHCKRNGNILMFNIL